MGPGAPTANRAGSHARASPSALGPGSSARSGVVVQRDALPRGRVAWRGAPDRRPSTTSCRYANPFAAERLQTTTSQLFQKRVIRLGGAVDDASCNSIVAQLLYLDADAPGRDISLYINSPGGSVTAGMAVFDVMRHVRPDVSTVCAGLAASMGAFLLAAGHPGKRYAFPSTRIMIHQPLGGAQGQVDDVEIQANEMLHHKLTLNAYLSEFTGQPIERIERDTRRDFYMTAQEAIQYGMVDAVVARALGPSRGGGGGFGSTPGRGGGGGGEGSTGGGYDGAGEKGDEATPEKAAEPQAA